MANRSSLAAAAAASALDLGAVRSMQADANVRSSIPATRQDGVPDLRAGGDLAAYALDWTERTILFCDTLRQRADNMIAHERAGKPPLLDFDFEVLLDARRFPEPANYALLRITRAGEACLDDCFDPTKPPVIVVDPRAGHGPGIGGFKRESEVGMALHEGHAVYFVVFYPEPVPSQELTNVLHALRRFVEEVAQRHDGRPPVLRSGAAMRGMSLRVPDRSASQLTHSGHHEPSFRGAMASHASGSR